MAECMITACMNHSLSDTNCTASSADTVTVTDTNDKTTVISTDVTMTSDDILTTHDLENNTIIASTTVLEDSTNLRPLITTTSTAEKNNSLPTPYMQGR